MSVPLITHILNGLIRWADEDQPGLGTFLRKCRVLTQLHNKLKLVFHLECKYAQPTYKAIARVDRLTPFSLCNLNNSITIEVRRNRAQIKGEGGAQGML